MKVGQTTSHINHKADGYGELTNEAGPQLEMDHLATGQYNISVNLSCNRAMFLQCRPNLKTVNMTLQHKTSSQRPNDSGKH